MFSPFQHVSTRVILTISPNFIMIVSVEFLHTMRPHRSCCLCSFAIRITNGSTFIANETAAKQNKEKNTSVPIGRPDCVFFLILLGHKFIVAVHELFYNSSIIIIGACTNAESPTCVWLVHGHATTPDAHSNYISYSHFCLLFVLAMHHVPHFQTAVTHLCISLHKIGMCDRTLAHAPF